MGNKENQGYRNSVFVDLFYEDETADANDIALYNALHAEQLPEGTHIRRFRVDNVLYMNFRNDMSFGVMDKVIVFGEHQSSINKNMPLRSLMYIGRAYEQLVPVEERYKKKLIKLPTPEFYTFYNGKDICPKEEVLCLSEAFVKDPVLEGTLELKVRVINIKPEQRHELLEKCKIMHEYSLFIECVERYRASGNPEAIKYAVKECIEKGILKEYLKRKGSQVENMLIAEYDYETDIKVQRNEAWEDGLEQGLEQGRVEEKRKLIEKLVRAQKTDREIMELLECSQSLVEDVRKMII